MLQLGLTRPDTGESWEGQFEEDFIESLTKKTGNAKSFKVFCKMLSSALEQSSESVLVDVLTARDLELLKERKVRESSSGGHGQGRQRSLGSAAKLDDSKMFVILTYLVEFDKVHYPLSLTKVNPGTDKQHLLGVIDSLRKELASAKSQGPILKNLGQNPGLDISMSRSHAPTQTYVGSNMMGDHLNLISPLSEIIPKSYGARYAGQHQETTFLAPQDNSSHLALVEAAQQKVKLLEAKIEALQAQHTRAANDLQQEHAEEMRTVLRHAKDLEERLEAAEKEIEEWKAVAEQRRDAGGKEKERSLQREVEALKRKLNEANSNEKLLRAQLKEARETIDIERKKFGVAYRPASREKVQRLGSPWKRPVSRSGRFTSLVSLDRNSPKSAQKSNKKTSLPKRTVNPSPGIPSRTRMSPKPIPRDRQIPYTSGLRRNHDSSEMAPRRKNSSTLNSSQLSNGSRQSNKSSRHSSATKNRGQRDDSIEMRRKRLQQRVREDEPVIRTGKARPGDDVKKIDDELEEIDAKFHRLKQLMKMTTDGGNLSNF